MNYKQKLWALVALILTALFVVSPAFAQDTAKEGENVFIIRGEDPAYTYVKVGERANLDTDSFAKLFNTDAASIRADNPTKTLAVCRVSRNRFVMQRGIRSPADRARQDVWRDCPAESQKVYLVPGETLVLKGMKHLSFAEEQRVLASIKKCEGASCVLAAAQPLVPEVELGTAPPPIVAMPSEPQAPPPAAPAAEQSPTEEASPTPPAAASPPPPVQETGGSDAPFIGMLLLAVAALFGMLYMGHRANQAEALAARRFDKDRARLDDRIAFLEKGWAKEKADLHGLLDAGAKDIKTLQQRLDGLTDTLRVMTNKLHKAFFNVNNAADEQHDPKQWIERLHDQLIAWHADLYEALRSQRASVTTGPIDYEAVMTSEFVRETTELMTSAHASGQTAEGERRALLRGLHNLLLEFEDEEGVDEARQTLVAEDAESVCATLHERLLRISARVQREAGDLLLAMTGEGPHATHRPFDTSSLREAFVALDGVYQQLERVLRDDAHGVKELPSTMVERIVCACDVISDQRHALASYRADIARQEGDIARLHRRLESEEGSGVKPIPRESDVEAQGGYTRRNTLRPPSDSAVPPAPDGMWRSHLFGGIEAFLKRYEDHAVVPLQGAAESGFVIRLYEFLNTRKFQIPMETGVRAFSPRNPREDSELWGYLQRFGAVSLA